ncbi:MAG: DUF393 domain-containing protein [Capsulimonadaceae bacterium]|nr:DUF393 domain-containing protein [Capsulimonadaceae bacterium]
MARVSVERSKILVFYDASCALCMASRSLGLKLDPARVLHWIDSRDPLATLVAGNRFTTEDFSRRIHIRLPDGTWRIGYWAVAEMARRLPLPHWLSSFLSFPLMAEAGNRIYNFVADHRRWTYRKCPVCSATDSNVHRQ